jgi:hypothetical protein
MPMRGLAILALAAAGLYAFGKGKGKGKLPNMLSEDCTQLLTTSGTLDALRWQDNYVAKHPLPPPPSDPDTLRDWIASFVSSFMRDAAPQCTSFFQVPYEEWPAALVVLYERLVFNAAVWLERGGYDVAVPPPPKEF